MPGFISKPHGEDLDFELFSNIVLKFTAILMVVLVLLAINVGQKLDQIISPYRFSGGLARPELYLASFETDNRRDAVKMMVALYSKSIAEAITTVDPATRKTVSQPGHETETFSGSYFAPPYPMLTLLAGISPGSILIDGKQSPFVVPHFTQERGYFYWDKDDKMHRTPALQEQITRNFLELWSGTYANPVYPTRAFSEYRDIRTRIYVETGSHNFLIGNETVSAAQIKAGKLDFLTSLSSTNTEVVYLGDFTADASEQRNSRLDFYEQNGFADAAKHARSRNYPSAADLDLAKDFYKLLTAWDQLAAEAKSNWLNGANGDADLARQHYELSIARRASANYRNSLLEDAVRKGVKPDLYALPTVLAYPDAWQAYVNYRMKANPTPPDWFAAEFLEPLGFNKRVVVIEQ
jgi:hypothetical protein